MAKVDTADFAFWIRPSAPVKDEPLVRLYRWTVKRDQSGNCYFVGHRNNGNTVRVSTPIVEFDPAGNCGRTASGRLYELIGPENRGGDTDLMWQLWCLTWGISSVAGEVS